MWFNIFAGLDAVHNNESYFIPRVMTMLQKIRERAYLTAAVRKTRSKATPGRSTRKLIYKA